jgi:hypothetical protein
MSETVLIKSIKWSIRALLKRCSRITQNGFTSRRDFDQTNPHVPLVPFFFN